MIYFSEKVSGQTLFELRDQIEEMETMRNFTIRHDHADINKQSHYLFTVSFLYDTAYETSEECGWVLGTNSRMAENYSLETQHMNNAGDIAIDIF